MNAARAALFIGACTGFGCGGAPVRGGYTARDTRPSHVKTLAEFVPGHCEDSSHADRAPRVASVEIVETRTGRTLLFEHRQGHELLVAENHFDDGSRWVFQVVVNAENLVREWRIPRSVGATGTLVVGRELGEVAYAEHFQAKLASTVLSCSLVPASSDLPRGSTNAVP
jgi:hypothetical protein